MKSTIERWGDSAAVRIPAAVLSAANFFPDQVATRPTKRPPFVKTQRVGHPEPQRCATRHKKMGRQRGRQDSGCSDAGRELQLGRGR
jgi:hypothetical protein